MALYKDFVVKQGIIAEGTQESQTTASGTLVIGGGAGLGGSINIAGSIKRTGNVTGQDHSVGAQLSLRDGIFTDSLVSGRTAWGVVNYFGSTTLDTISENATYTNATSVYIKGAPKAGTNLTIEKLWSLYITSGTVYIGEGSGSTSTSDGNALQIAGGLSVGNGVYAAGGGSLFGNYALNGSEILTRATANVGLVEFPDGINITTTTNSYSTTTGALIVVGGVGIGKNLNVGGNFVSTGTVNIWSTFPASSTSSAALAVAGGLAVGQTLFAEGGVFTIGRQSTSSVGGNSLQLTNGGGLGVSGSALIEGQLWVTDNTDATSLDTGAIVVYGGVNVRRNLRVDTEAVLSQTAASDVSTAALTVAGGVGIAKNLIIGSTATSTGTAASNALVVAGGASIGGDIRVDGSAVIKGDLILLGTATQVTINSTNTYIVDPLIEIGGGVDGAMLQIPDTYDKGLLIHYQNAVNTVTDYRAFAGFENTNQRFILKQNIIPTVGGEDPFGNFYNSGTWSTLEVGSLILKDNTTATNAATGALIVAGGISVNSDSLFATTATWGSYAYSISSIADNAIRVPEGGIGTKYLYVQEKAYVNNAEVLTTGTVNAGIGGIFTNTFLFTNLTQSDGTDTGALIMWGGVGIGKNLNVGGNATFTGTVIIRDLTQSDNSYSGALVVAGGVGVGKNLNVGGIVRITDPTNSTTSTDGSFAIAGGAGIAKDLYVGGDTTVTNKLTVSTLRVISDIDSTITTDGATTIGGGLGVAKTINADRINIRTASVNSGTDANSTTSGDLTVVGGVGIGRSVWVGGNLHVLSTATSGSINTGSIVTAGGLAVTKDVYIGGTIVRNGQVTKDTIGTVGAGLVLSPSTYVDSSTISAGADIVAVHSIGKPTIIGVMAPAWNDAATLYIDDAPALGGGATATKSWALYISTGSVKINSPTVNIGNTTSGALNVVGGVGIGGNLTVGGSIRATDLRIGPITDPLLNRISSTSLAGKTDSIPVLIDTYVGGEFTTAKYLVQVTDLGYPNKFHVVELMVTYDGSATQNGIYISQYGLITNTGELGTFDISYNAGDIGIVFTPNYTPVSMNIRSLRMAIVT
jgi:enhancing lycopene biosynthesis protein 2